MNDTTLWFALLAASVVVLGVKAMGHLIPRTWLESSLSTQISSLVTVGILAALVAVQAATTGNKLVADSRLIAVAVAGVALWFKAPFIVVIVVAAVVAATLRALGMP